MSLQVRQYGDIWHVTTGNSRFGLGSWGAFSSEHVARNFAAWLDALGDVEALGERVATGQMTGADYRLAAQINNRRKHAAFISNTRTSIYAMVYGK